MQISVEKARLLLIKGGLDSWSSRICNNMHILRLSNKYRHVQQLLDQTPCQIGRIVFYPQVYVIVYIVRESNSYMINKHHLQ